MAANTSPRILGRFNYLSTHPDFYDVLFRPMYGNVVVIIARNLCRKDALDLTKALNTEIDETRRLLESEVIEDDEL